jgi:small conductance mechanosensitive channel
MDFSLATIQTYITSMGLKLIVAILVLFIGLKISKILVNIFTKAMKKKELDVSLTLFLSSVISWLLKVCVVIAAINTAGIQTTSFIALLGSAGLAVGLALQGSLANFAGGVLILILKPFKVGDVIKAQGFIGTVEKITTFATILKTPDNQVITLPNGSLANAPIVNVNQESTRRVDFTFGIGYGDSIKDAKEILNKIISSDSRILKDPAHVIVVGELADSSVNIIVRAWTNTADYWGVFFEVTEKVKLEFDAQNISIPFPQRDVHLHQVNS